MIANLNQSNFNMILISNEKKKDERELIYLIKTMRRDEEFVE